MKRSNSRNAKFIGADKRKSLIDLTLPKSYSGKLVLFVHGFMGFKDWGAWHLMEEYFVNLGFGFCKYNVSHNGCSTSDGSNFVDLDAFAENNYTKEKDDLYAVLDWLGGQIQPLPEIYVIGHSRGGGVVLLSANDARINKIATWAAISDIERRFPSGDALQKWKEEGVRFQTNGRTNQAMPLNFSQYENFIANSEELDIKHSVESIRKPLLLLHGNEDTSVPISEGEELSEWSGIPLSIIKGANHTFGSAHPWKEQALPLHLNQVCKITAEFFLTTRK